MKLCWCLKEKNETIANHNLEESEKVGLMLNIQKTNIMASGPITSWQIEGEKVGAVTDFLFLSSKITVDGDCSHSIKKAKILASSPITSWQIEGEKVEAVTYFIFLGS